MLMSYFKRPQVVERYRSGLLGRFLDGFAGWLQEAGYARNTIRFHLHAAIHLNCWATKLNIPLERWDEQTLKRFRRHLRSCRCLGPNQGKYQYTAAGVRSFLRYLKHLGIRVPADVARPRSVESPLVVSFHRWMVERRGATEATVKGYSRFIRNLLKTVGEDPRRLDARCLRTFVIGLTGSRRVAQHACTALRMFLRYLIAEGMCPATLESAIPSVAHWRLAELPAYLSASDVERVIATCDTSTPLGLRDRAVLLLVARLGLRAGDVIRIRLSDIDWSAASLRVAGKGRREARLPLTQEVGDAILAYLEHGRPKVSAEHLFLRELAPIRAWSTSDKVTAIAAKAIRSAGVIAPSYGCRVLRHSAATQMLREGASLHDIAVMLRHRSITTTTIYAKVDTASLNLIAQPWPKVKTC
jgi:site-specific recombinase XerD